jgi:hypothetical protein
MCTVKNQLIPSLCSVDPNFPLHLWDQLLPQALLTLNLLLGSHINPRLSVHAQIHRPFDFNKTPIGPSGMRVAVIETPKVRETWAPHAVDGWYLGPAFGHYRCLITWIIETPTERVSDTVVWFPSKAVMPTASSTESACAAALDLIQALRYQTTVSALTPLVDSEHTALLRLMEIFKSRFPVSEPIPNPNVVPPVPPDLHPSPQLILPIPATVGMPSANPSVAELQSRVAIQSIQPPSPMPATYASKTTNLRQRRLKAKRQCNCQQRGYPSSPPTSHVERAASVPTADVFIPHCHGT